jgi:hypothetical protein
MGRTGVRDLMFVGPLGDLGALRVMNGSSHTEDAESAKAAKKDRLTVASHLVCDVDVRRRSQAPTLQRKGLGVLCVMRAIGISTTSSRQGCQERQTQCSVAWLDRRTLSGYHRWQLQSWSANERTRGGRGAAASKRVYKMRLRLSYP